MLEIIGCDDYLAPFAVDNVYSEFADFFKDKLSGRVQIRRELICAHNCGPSQ